MFLVRLRKAFYFHEQTSEKVKDEVSEYIITGGWNKDHPNYKRVPDGIHEQYVRLLKAIEKEMSKHEGPSLPTAWISGFYGSGKSSFAKLLGLALDGMELPNGKSLSESLLARDMSHRAEEFRNAWTKLREKIEEPFSVVFDIGGSLSQYRFSGVVVGHQRAVFRNSINASIASGVPIR